jgi:hypothetical protein
MSYHNSGTLQGQNVSVKILFSADNNFDNEFVWSSLIVEN